MSLLLSSTEYDAVIFDLDGVVTDTAALHEAAWRRLFADLFALRPERSGEDHRPFTRDDYLAHVDGKSRYDGAHDFLASRGIVLPQGRSSDRPGWMTVCGLANRKDAYFMELVSVHGVRVFDSTVRLVKSLRAHEIRTAVISASRHCRSVLAAAGLAGLFPVRVDGVDVELLNLPGKPDAAIFIEAAQRLGVDPGRTVVVEDAESGVEAARRGGFGLVVGVDRLGAGERLLAHGADVVVADLSEVRVTASADAPRPLDVAEPDADELP